MKHGRGNISRAGTYWWHFLLLGLDPFGPRRHVGEYTIAAITASDEPCRTRVLRRGIWCGGARELGCLAVASLASRPVDGGVLADEALPIVAFVVTGVIGIVKGVGERRVHLLMSSRR